MPEAADDPRRPSERARRTAHYRFAVRSPIRWLFIASACAVVGFVEVVAWAALDAPPFVLQAGIILFVVAAALGLWSLVFRLRARWTLSLTPSELTIARGSSRTTTLPWSRVSGTDLRRSHLLVLGDGAAPLARLLLDSRAVDRTLLTDLRAAINRHVTAARD